MIGIIGHSRSGKDTTANYIVKKYKYEKYALASPIRQIAKIMFFFSDNELETKSSKKNIIWDVTPREAMQLIGTENGSRCI